MYDLERFYGTKVGFYKGTDSYKSYKLVQTSNFSFKLMPYTQVFGWSERDQLKRQRQMGQVCKYVQLILTD